mgnify:CR=1 FL=1
MTLDPLRHLSGAGQRLLAAWAALGATVQACLPPLHGLDTALGPVALWLWLLPLAALALAWLLVPAAAGTGADRLHGRGRRPPAPRRRTAGAAATTAARPGRPRAALRPVAGRQRQAG